MKQRNKTYSEGLKEGAEVASETYKHELEKLRRKVKELELEISLNKRGWRSIKIIDIKPTAHP
jgi:hypothetical protein